MADKSMWKMISEQFGFSSAMFAGVNRPTAIGFEGKAIGDFDSQITYIVYFTNEAHTEEYADIEYFDERDDAEEFAKGAAKLYKVKYVGEYGV